MPISYHGIFHYRSGTTKQELNGTALQDFIFKKMGSSWDDIANDYAMLEDIDDEAVVYFLRRVVQCGRMDEKSLNDDTETVLKNLNLYDNNRHIKNAALLLFGKRPSKFFTLCDFRIGRFGASQADLMFQDVIEGDLIRMCDKIINILRSKYLIAPIHYEGLQRIEPLEIPEPALREAILNAIIHKDYRGVHIQMRVWNDRIEIWNEGKLPEDWTVENLFQKHSSKPRNRNIALAFYKAGFIENWGRGIDKICDGLKDGGLKPPVYEYTCDGIQTTIFRKESFVSSENTQFSLNKVPNKIENPSLNSLDKQILELLKINPHITYIELSEKCNKNQDTIATHLKNLQERNLIQRIGSKKTGHWQIIEEAK